MRGRAGETRSFGVRERNERGECERDSKPRSAGGQSKWRERREKL